MMRKPNSYPVEVFIGGPLQATVNSQLMLADSTAKFIENVGYGRGNQPRNVPFSYNRTVFDEEKQEYINEEVLIEVPLMSLIKVPNMEISNLKYAFSFDLDHIEYNDDLKDTNENIHRDFSQIQLHGMITTSREYTRNTDKSKKIHFEIQAINSQTPEGLARVMDLMNQAITPRVIRKDQNHHKSNGKMDSERGEA